MEQRSGSTVTFLFTDLVDSTALSHRLGDDAAQALRRAHDRILRDCFSTFRGEVVKGMGDGFMVVFPSARQGVECAVALQQAIAGQQAAGRYPDLRVRAGLHTGEPVAEAGDYFGPDVTLASRIAAEASGGQVLVSQVTRLLAGEYDGLSYASLGERALKGFPHPTPLFELRWPDERVAGPRLTRFVGRHAERARLRERLDEARRGRGSLVLVAGEPGVGKTRLVREVAIDALDRGFVVLSGQAHESERVVAYLPIAEALGQFVRGRAADELQQTLGDGAGYVAKLVPQLTRALPGIAEATALDPEAERYRLFEAVSDFLLGAAAVQPIVLFLDDMHWADNASLHLLQHLARRLATAPLLAVATYREVEAGESHPLVDLAAEVARTGLGQCVSLSSFGRDEFAGLAEAILADTAPEQLLGAIYRVTQGNPFFTEELVQDLREQGSDLTDASQSLGNWAVPEGVRYVVLKRLQRLSEGANTVLASSSVLGRDVTLAEVAAVTGQAQDALLDVLDESLGAGVLREERESFAFAHPLIRETLYQQLSSARRRALHLRVAEALERLYDSDLALHLAEIAHHFFEGASADDAWEKAREYAMLAGERAISVSAYEEAVQHYRRALAAVENGHTVDDTKRCAALLALGDAQVKAGDGVGAGETFPAAAGLAKAAGRADLLARAALGFGDVRRSAGFVDEPLLALLTDALSALGEEDSGLRARVLARSAAALYHVAPHEQLMSMSRHAVEIARRIDDPPAVVYVLSTTHFYLHELDDAEGRLDAAGETIRLAEEIGDRQKALEARRWRMVDLLEVGDIATFDAELEEFDRLANELRQPWVLWQVAVCRAMRSLLAGRFEEAEPLIHEALSFGQRLQSETELAAQIFGVQLFTLRREQGRLAELEETLRRMGEQAPAGGWENGLAYLHSELGHTEEAQTAFNRLAADDFARVPFDFNRRATLTLLAEVCSYLGDTKRAAALYELLLPSAHRAVTAAATATCAGSVARSLGVLATTLGRWEDAERHFTAALEMNTRMDAAPFVAHTQHQFGAMLLAWGQPGDRERAIALVREALAAAEALGMEGVVARASDLLARAERA